MKITATTAMGIAIALSLLGPTPAFAVGGSFACERSSAVEVSEEVDGSFALQNIVAEYMLRWDAQEATRQCEAYAAGEPYEISCLNGRRDWPAILASVPRDYFGRSNKSLAEVAHAEKRRDNGFKAAMDYCRSVGAIR